MNGKEPYYGTYKNLEYFIEGHTYMKKIVLSCNDGEIQLSNVNIQNSVPNLTWFCDEYGKAKFELTNFLFN